MVQAYGGNRQSALAIFLEQEMLDILCLQEHRLTDVSDMKREMVKIPGYVSFWSFSEKEQKGYSGVAMYVREGLVTEVFEGFHCDEFLIAGDEGRILTAKLGGLKMVIVNVYVPNAQSDGGVVELRQTGKMEFLAALDKHVEYYQEEGWKVILVGDLNMAHHPIDVSSVQK
ncbi:hypothetical protein HK097_004885, partial [Rhizophlyctis rosea]